MQAERYSTITPRTVSDQNGIGHSPGLSVSTSNSSCCCTMRRSHDPGRKRYFYGVATYGTTA